MSGDSLQLIERLTFNGWGAGALGMSRAPFGGAQVLLGVNTWRTGRSDWKEEAVQRGESAVAHLMGDGAYRRRDLIACTVAEAYVEGILSARTRLKLVNKSQNLLRESIPAVAQDA
eukprot:scaffold170281_cov29-Tisochrysis_lutea.AAC.8